MDVPAILQEAFEISEEDTNLLLEAANGWFRFFDLRGWDGKRFLVSGARR